MPVNPQVLQELIKKYGKRAVSAAVNAAKAKVIVPNMTGTATSAGTALRDIPKVESTVGREAAVAATALASPAASGRTVQELLQDFRSAGGTDMSEFAERVHSIVGDHASNLYNLPFEQVRDLNRALTSLTRDEGMQFSAAYTYDNPQVLRGAVRGRYADALDDYYLTNTPQFSSLDEAAEALNEAATMRAHDAAGTIRDFLIYNEASPLRSALINSELVPDIIPEYIKENTLADLLDSGAITASHPLVSGKLASYESGLRQMPTEQIFYKEFVPKYSSSHAYDYSDSALDRLEREFGTKIKDDPAQRRQHLKAIIDKYSLDKTQTRQLIQSMPWNEEYMDYKGLIDLVSGNVPLGASAQNDLRAIVKSAYGRPSFYTPSGMEKFKADIAEKILRERIPGLPDTPLSTVRDAYAPGYIDLAKSLREAGLAEMPSDVSGLGWFQVQQAAANPGAASTPLAKAIAEWQGLRAIPQARQRVDLQTRLLKAATPRETGVFEPHSSVDSYNVLGKNALPTGSGKYGPGVTNSTYGLGPNDVSLVQIPVNKYGFDSVDLYESGNAMQLNGLVMGSNGVVSNTAGKPLFSVPQNGWQLLDDAYSSTLTPREYMAHNPDTRTLVDNIIGSIRDINKIDVDRTAGMLKRVNMQNKRVGAPLVDAPVYNTYYTSDNPLFYEDGNYYDMLSTAREFLSSAPYGKYSTLMKRSPIMSLRHKDGGTIHIDPSKKGTFKAQASKMGMSVKQAASHILAHPENYSPAMRKKANFARNFAEDGGPVDRSKKARFDKPISWYVSQKPEMYPTINKIRPEYLDKYFIINDAGQIVDNTARNAFVNRKKEVRGTTGSISYNQDNEIMLTTSGANARYRTGRISTDLLDYIYDNASKAGIPFREAVGLAGKESTLGIGRGYKRGASISPIDLYSFWNGVGDAVKTNKWHNNADKLYKSMYAGEELDMEAFDKIENEYRRLYDNLHEYRGDNLVKDAYDYYKAGKYNPGEKGYDADVIVQGDAILSDPAVQKWLKTKKTYNGRGFTFGGTLDRLKKVYGDDMDSMLAAILRAKNVKKQS